MRHDFHFKAAVGQDAGVAQAQSIGHQRIEASVFLLPVGETISVRVVVRAAARGVERPEVRPLPRVSEAILVAIIRKRGADQEDLPAVGAEGQSIRAPTNETCGRAGNLPKKT